MRIPDPENPVQGPRFIVWGAIGCGVFTLVMAIGTYVFATLWAHWHAVPPTLPRK